MLSPTECLAQTMSLFPSLLVLEGTQILLVCYCLVSHQRWISTRSSFRCHWYKNTPVLLPRSFNPLTFSIGVEAIHFPSAGPFGLIFKPSLTCLAQALSLPEEPLTPLPPHPSVARGFYDVFRTQSFRHASSYPMVTSPSC